MGLSLKNILKKRAVEKAIFQGRKRQNELMPFAKKLKSRETGNEISDNLYYFLLASLLESADKVANTASVYGAFFWNISKSRLKRFVD